jgi:topoisomerase IA-like protein
MEKKNIFLGKIEKNGCYVNNGQYGFFLTCDKKNYKIPEWLKPEEVTLEMAERLIEYKKKISEVWLEKKSKKKSDDDDESGKPRIINK